MYELLGAYLFLTIAFMWSMKNSKGTMQVAIRTILFCIAARRIPAIRLHLALKGIVKISLFWEVQWHSSPVLSGHYCIKIYTDRIVTDSGKY